MRAGLILLALLFCAPTYALDPMAEYRICTVEPKRDRHGRIHRRADVLTAFRTLYPCPATGRTTGRCDGWAIDHVIPLAMGGCDAVLNLQWLPDKLKSCPGICKDRWERTIYRKDRQ